MSMRDPDDAVLIRVARALGDPTRLAFLRAVAQADELSCQELTARFALSQATVSHHLKVLSQAGLVLVRKGGPYHFYRAHGATLRAHAAAVRALAAPARHVAPARRGGEGARRAAGERRERAS